MCLFYTYLFMIPVSLHGIYLAFTLKLLFIKSQKFFLCWLMLREKEKDKKRESRISLKFLFLFDIYFFWFPVNFILNMRNFLIIE